MSATVSTDWLPNMFGDCREALSWWLANPALEHFFPGKVAASLKLAADLQPQQRRELLMRLRGSLRKARTSQGHPQGLPKMPRREFEKRLAFIADIGERTQVFCLSCACLECELPWLADRLIAVQAARTAAKFSQPD